MKQRVCFVVTAFSIIMNLPQVASAQNTSPFWSLDGNSNASALTTKFGTTNAVNLGIFTNNIERLRILSSNGNVGIGTLTPTERLRISGPAGVNAMRVQVNGITKFMINQNGGVAVGSSTVPPVNGLYVAGRVGLGIKEPTARLEIGGSSSYQTVLKVTNGNIRVTSDWGTGDNSVGVFAEGGIGLEGHGMTGVKGYGMTGVQGEGTIGIIGFTTDGGSAYGAVEGRGGTQGVGGLFTSSNYAALRVEGNTLFYGTVWAANGYVTSDRNLKQDVTEFGDALAIIGKLKPRNYQFKTDPKYSFLHLPAGAHYGLMAQDVEEVLPNLVSTADHHSINLRDQPSKTGSGSNAQEVLQREKGASITIKAVNYVELIPIMIKAMQEQELEKISLKAKLADQQEQITELRKMLMDIKNEKNSTVNFTGAFLEQNTPNPVRNNTLIHCYIPESTSNAKLTLTNAKGQIIRTIILTNRGSANVNLDASMLAAGTYNYALYVDGKQAATKQLIVAR